jgi:flagellar hook protein FlgE
MLGALYIGLSGMDAYSKGLQVISNNVANLNTPGYKSSTTDFSDLYSNNAGVGVRLGSSTVNFAQGELRQTNNDLDLAIQGNGFLTLHNKDGQVYYTRTGSFSVDKDGFISTSDGQYRLTVLDSNGKPIDVNIGANRTNPPAATTKITFADNLSSSGTTATVSDVAVFDSSGTKRTWTLTFAKASSGNEWTVTVKDNNGNTVGNPATLNFIGGTVDPTTSKLTITDSPAGADPLSVTLDFSSGVTSFSGGSSSTLRAAAVDGNGAGALTGVTVNTGGQVNVAYSNGKNQLMGAVALADFPDPQALERIGNGIYRDQSAGQPRYLASNTDGMGKLVSKELEGSNVDLSAEFGLLILIQRGFQASSQVVSISNDMIQTLFGIRGQ